jgi:alanyl-tRNA synthetase
MRITSTELCTKYLEFFGQHRHVVIPSASLVPANDPTVLFTTAGMHPLVPYLLGEPHPLGARLANVQKCVRTGDIDVVGDDTHLTFFEMLGNWSLGDYGRDDAIRWSHDFLTRVLGLPLARLGVTCFAGDDEVPPDDDSIGAWLAHGIPRGRIQALGRDDNWWGPAGKTGPCGPDTEMFFWVDDAPPPATLDVRDRRWVEIWNNVFMSYRKTASGTIEPMPRVNVDTGMGVERTLVALNNLRSVYEVDTIRPLYDAVRGLAPSGDERGVRVLVDHVRAAAFIITDGVEPSNKDRGYVLRRLVRRGALVARRLGLHGDWHRAAIAAIDPGPYGLELDRVTRVIADELAAFDRTLVAGKRLLDKHAVVDGKLAFDLYQSYGYPFELVRELAGDKLVDEDGFHRELAAHRERSRSVAGGFAGGLADHGDATVRYHTLTHLLHAALRGVLGDHVIQRGSNITPVRLRFDYAHHDKPTPDQLARVQSLVDGWLARDLLVERTTMTEPEARALGAIGAFGERYGDTVSVYTIRDGATGDVISREFCGGPHVASSAELRGRFRIVREQAISAGVRRIRAVLEPG